MAWLSTLFGVRRKQADPSVTPAPTRSEPDSRATSDIQYQERWLIEQRTEESRWQAEQKAEAERWLIEQQVASERSLLSRAGQTLIGCVALFSFLFVVPGVVARVDPETDLGRFGVVVVAALLAVAAYQSFRVLRVKSERLTGSTSLTQASRANERLLEQMATHTQRAVTFVALAVIGIALWVVLSASGSLGSGSTSPVP